MKNLAALRAHHTWRLELDGKPCREWPTDPEAKPQKVPHRVSGKGRLAGAYGEDGSYDPKGRGTFAEAQKGAELLLDGGYIGGIGVTMGPVPGDPDTCIGGVDVDSGRNPETGDLAPWASPMVDDIADGLDIYWEVSPSGTGVKGYFTYDRADLPALLAALGGFKGEWKRPDLRRPGMRHDPGIEKFLAKGWFAVTGQRLREAREDVVRVARTRLLRVIREDGPTFAGNKTPAPVAPVEAADDDDLHDEPDWTRIKAGSAALPPFRRDDRPYWLRMGMAIHHESGGSEEGFDAWDEWSQASDKYDAKDQRRVWRSFKLDKENPVKIGTLYREAKKYRSAENAGEYRNRSPAELAVSYSRDYLIKGFLKPRKLGCLIGDPGAGKTLFAPLICYRVSRGEPVFGMRVRQGTVFFVTNEDEDGAELRILALVEKYGPAPDLRLITGNIDLYNPESQSLARLRRDIAAEKPALIFIDTLMACFPGVDDNTPEGMGRVIAVMKELSAQGAAVMITHHPAKAAAKRPRPPRGHGSFNGALDLTIDLERGENQISVALLGKNRQGTTVRDIAIQIESLWFGKDIDGDAIEAPVGVEVEPGSVPKAPLPLSKSEFAALRILREMKAAEGGNSVEEAEWRKRCAAGYDVSPAMKQDSRRVAVTRAVGGLLDKKRIRIGDDKRVVLLATDSPSANQGDEDHGFDDA